MPSESGFLLMTYGQDRQDIAIYPIADDVSAFAKINEPLSILIRQVVYEAAHFWMGAKGLHTFENSSGCALGSGRTFGLQESPKAFKVANSCWGENYLWHSGAACSSSVPHLESQFSTSPAVTWRPVA